MAVPVPFGRIGAMARAPSTSSPQLRAAIGVGLVVASFLVGWWLIGDVSESDPNLSYMIRAPHLPAVLLAGLGLAGAVALAVMLRWVWSSCAGRKPALLLALSGLALAFIGRLVTAGSIGANIGGGMAVFLLLPPLALLASMSLILFIRRVREP
jgi:hypothetical protein